MPSKTIAISQSNYIPWKGYFDLIAQVDEFVLLDDVQYTRRDWRNRNQIKTPQGVQWLSIPVRVKSRFFQNINEAEVVGSDWAQRHWRSIKQNYSQCQGFKIYGEKLEKLYQKASTFSSLMDINELFLREFLKWLEIKTPVLRIETKNATCANATERLIAICRERGASTYISGPRASAYIDEEAFLKAGIKLEYINYGPYPEYKQRYLPFVHQVSVIDLFLNVGQQASPYVKNLSVARWLCGNCEGITSRFEERINSYEKRVVSSDGKFLKNFSATKRFCTKCGCFEIICDDPHRSERFYREEYDVSTRRQNNWVITEKGREEKHSLLERNLLSALKKEKTVSSPRFLELGCGNGQFLRNLKANLKDWQAMGIDPQCSVGEMEKIASSTLNDSPPGIQIIKGFFKPGFFEKQKFNLVIAHSLLNRIPTFPALAEIQAMLKPEGLMSVEVVCLEDSDYAPFVWDHCYTFTSKAFENYLISAGFEILNQYFCGSTRQYICRKQAEVKDIDFAFPVIQETLDWYRRHRNLWERRKAKIVEEINNDQLKFGVFGAGLYSAVLLSHIEEAIDSIEFVIDERYQEAKISEFLNLRLKPIGELSEKDCILLCTRPGYSAHIQSVLAGTPAQIKLLD